MLFGPFRVLPAQQLLLEADKPVRLGSRALEILIALVERAGELVSKEDLVARVWPSTFVEEGSLRVHVAALRRALGDGQAGRRYVANVPGRGYQFVAPVTVLDETPPRLVDRPQSISRTICRPSSRAWSAATTPSDALMAQLPQRRFITIVGPGGIGKTTVALAVADALAGSYEDGARFVDLTLVNNNRARPGRPCFPARDCEPASTIRSQA